VMTPLPKRTWNGC